MSYQFSDLQEAVEALPALKLSYRQLERGPFHATIGLQGVGEITAATVSSNRLIEGRGHVESGQVLFVLCTGGQADNRYDDLLLCPGQVYLKSGDTPPGQQLLKAGYQAVLLTAPAQLLESHLGRPLDADLATGTVLDLDRSVALGILGLVRESGLPAACGQRQLSDLLTRLLCRGLRLADIEATPRRLNSKVQLARAIRERLEDCPEMTFGDISADLAISERTLRRVFGEVYSISPGQYHLTVRLNQVRDQLKAGGAVKGTISELAARHGFWHMGRFATQYRRQFGETPTQTMVGQIGIGKLYPRR